MPLTGWPGRTCPALVRRHVIRWHYVSEQKHDWPRVRLHVVTGKGGTGKSTVAAALALALASRGKNVLLCEVEGRQGIAQHVRRRPAALRGAPDRHRAPGRRVPATSTRSRIDPESALLEYLAMYYRLGRAGRALDRFGVIDFATTIAPGVRDVLLTGKVYEAVSATGATRTADPSTTRWCSTRRRPAGSPSSSTSTPSSPGWPRWARSSSQADTVMTLLRSPRTAVHLVTVLEEMPVQETADGIAELRRASLPGRRRGREPRPRPATSTPPTCEAARAGSLRPRQRPRGPGGGRGRGRQRPASTGWSRRPATTPSDEPSRTTSGRWSPSWTCRRTSCPGSPAASTSAGSTSSPPRSGNRGWHEQHREQPRTQPVPGRPARRVPRVLPRRRRAARRPAHRDHRVLRLRRGRQDHDLRRARAARGRARPQGRGPHHRPGPPAGPVDGHRGARQHPAPGRRGRPRRAAARSTR